MSLHKIGYITKKSFKRNSKKGQSSIEFVLIFPFLMALFIIFFQLGYCIYIKNIAEQSAREAVRIIATTNSNNKAISLINTNLNSKNVVIETIDIVPKDESQRSVGDYVKIRIKARYSGLSKILTNCLFAGLSNDKGLIEAESNMRMECSSKL